jgi:tRNA threonylcarbamoyladenosine biosynthesis protein TsaB
MSHESAPTLRSIRLADAPYNSVVSPNILAIETSANVGAVCVLHAGATTNDVVRDEVKLAAWLVPAIDRALERAGLKLDHIDAFAFGSGPGSFTGVRTACATAQALAYARGKPLYAVNSLQALAHSALSSIAQFHSVSDSIMSIVDARMNEAFSSCFKRRIGEVLECIEPASVSPLVSIVFDASAHVVGSGAVLVATRLGFSASRIDEIRSVTENAELGWADAIARIAQQRMIAGDAPLDPLHAEPEYVRNRVALTERERRALRNAETTVA